MIGEELLHLVYKASIGPPTSSLIVVPEHLGINAFQQPIIDYLNGMRFVADIKLVFKPHALQFLITRHGNPQTLSYVWIIHTNVAEEQLYGQKFNGTIIYYQLDPYNVELALKILATLDSGGDLKKIAV